MNQRALPPDDRLTICFAHVAYCLQERFLLRGTGIRSFELRTVDELKARVADADVLVVSGLWRNELAPLARRLVFIQSVGAGTDQFSVEVLQRSGIRLASAQGVNERAVAEHAMALILAYACGLRSVTPQIMSSIQRSLPYANSPVTLPLPSGRTGLVPTPPRSLASGRPASGAAGGAAGGAGARPGAPGARPGAPGARVGVVTPPSLTRPGEIHHRQ